MCAEACIQRQLWEMSSGSDTSWVVKKPLRRVGGGMSDALAIRSCLSRLSSPISGSLFSCKSDKNSKLLGLADNGDKFMELDCVNDSCSSSMANTNDVSASLKLDVDEYCKCSSGLFVGDPIGEDCSEKGTLYINS